MPSGRCLLLNQKEKKGNECHLTLEEFVILIILDILEDTLTFPLRLLLKYKTIVLFV